MGSTFNPQILVEKLAKLNNSQQSIETLSHWCIFHMNKAKQVVETWARQFHCSPREQRLAFLYLANDILQNSRRKGSEFVGEFWKVLPDALRDVIEHGDELGRNAALRLIGIWEERKVFGSRAQILKEELMGRHLENGSRNGKLSGFRLKHCGNTVDKLVSGYQVLYGGQLDEDVILSKCRNAINFIEKADKETAADIDSGKLHGSGFLEELQGQNGVLRDCIEQLSSIVSSRANLVSNLREALQEQEYKLDQVRSQLQAALAHSAQGSNMHGQLRNGGNEPEQGPKEAQASKMPHGFPAGSQEQLAPVMYTRQIPYPENPAHAVEDDPRKSAAAAVAEKLTASTSSAQMLTYVLSSLASEGVLGQTLKESPAAYQPEKRPKVENNDQSPYAPPPQNPQPRQMTPNGQPPPPSSSPPPLPPPPLVAPYGVPPQFIQQGSSSLQGYSAVGAPPAGMSPFSGAPPANPYQNFQGGSDGGFYSQQQPPSLPMAPISRQ